MNEKFKNILFLTFFILQRLPTSFHFSKEICFCLRFESLRDLLMDFTQPLN